MNSMIILNMLQWESKKDFVFASKLRHRLSNNTILLVTVENPLSIIFDEQI